MVEHNLAKVRVASSSLVFRSKEGESLLTESPLLHKEVTDFLFLPNPAEGFPLRLRIHSASVYFLYRP
ncbi:hypothetical protein POREN0001_0539 [Porphyromonas endodontalis ATCC 35406]|uniref:Uncharacterized protein n=1 Tax=Porphyromonas endodontalis (strain ATCC 35406 / DSM 24491 / JCM 8526 / CCUG 16442 / BCRC 14492 / NCTC 13058 / HG 370) TaxID=553175 RepID=C3J8M1_POREA|nr:hypothetical protein POREN0001_0539 [Porphyromonas endodontalis ATCC 35406]